jgi:hypothetical protein
MYVFTYYLRTKSFHKKITYCLAYVKKTKIGAKNRAFYGTYFIFFTLTT